MNKLGLFLAKNTTHILGLYFLGCPQLGYRDVPPEGRKPRLVHGYGSRHIQHLGAGTD